MSEQCEAAYLESEKEGYVLVDKRILMGNANAFAIAIAELSKIHLVPEEELAEIITVKGLRLAQEIPKEEIEKVVDKLIAGPQLSQISSACFRKQIK